MYAHPLLVPGGANGTLDAYEAVRKPDGWQTIRRLTPSGAQGVANPGGLSPDHRYGFVHVGLNSQPAPGTLGAEGSTDYLSNPDGSFEIVGVGSLGVERLAVGRFISENGEHIIFTSGGIWCQTDSLNCAKKQLEPTAPPDGTETVYERSADGPTKVVSLLPGDETPSAGEDADYQGASADGTAIAFKISRTDPVEVNLFVRKANVTTKVAEAPFTFTGISADGEKIFYIDAVSFQPGAPGNIIQFNVATKETKQLNTSGDAEVVNISADGSHVYFISRSELTPGAVAGQPNLYVWDEASEETRLVAIVSEGDLTEAAGLPALNTWTNQVMTPVSGGGAHGPGNNSSRTTPDGRVFVFESRGQLTPYPTNGHREIYRYDARPETLQCVSCNPLSSQSTGDARFQNAIALLRESGGAAAIIHNLSDDGSRVFFESDERLLREDVDGINDIYEWQPTVTGGALNLISSGLSKPIPIPEQEFTGDPPRPNTLIAITPSGSDVVFVSMDRLVPQAGVGGVSSLYDARIGGGFAEPKQGPPCYDESTCRGAAGPSGSLVHPNSESASSGNVAKHRHRHKRRRHCRARRHRKAGSEQRTCHRHKSTKAVKK
jgi:hypothetical protein